MATRQYHNPWITQAALDALAAERGPILDVGGGASPYARAAHVADIIPYDPGQLLANAWGGVRSEPWSPEEYTELDVCGRAAWPFSDKSFALGLCSHTLEDLRDPLPALAELGRVCEKILIVAPSRLLEQTRNIDHPRYCGFAHHPWMIHADGGGLVFRRKTAYLMFSGCHLTCPFGRTLPVERGVFVYHGVPVPGRELAYWSGEQEVEDYRRFLADQGPARGLFVRDARHPPTLRRRAYYLRQRLLGAT